MTLNQRVVNRLRELRGAGARLVARLQADRPGALSRLRLLQTNLRWFLSARRAEREDGWDLAMGTDTAGVVTQVGLGIERAARRHAHEYMATLPRTFDAMLATMNVDFRDYTLIDLGAGKGRTLLMAAGRGFRRVIGVEISPRLCEVARRNVEQAKIDAALRGRIEVRCEDALSFEFPAGPLVLYFFHAFDAEILRGVLGRLQSALAREPRPVFFAYLRPDHDALLRATGAFRAIAESPPRAPGSPEWPWRVYAVQGPADRQASWPRLRDAGAEAGS